MSSSATGNGHLFVVQVDSRSALSTADIRAYSDVKVPADFFRKLKEKSPTLVAHKSQIAAACGRDMTIYFVKSMRGFNSDFKQGGIPGVQQRMMSSPHMLRSNNGAATYLTTDLKSGYGDYIVTGRAYVVENGGSYPISKGQVWGLVEMVNCLMDVYPEDLNEGYRTSQKWAEAYRKREWEPPSGLGGMDIYSECKNT